MIAASKSQRIMTLSLVFKRRHTKRWILKILHAAIGGTFWLRSVVKTVNSPKLIINWNCFWHNINILPHILFPSKELFVRKIHFSVGWRKARSVNWKSFLHGVSITKNDPLSVYVNLWMACVDSSILLKWLVSKLNILAAPHTQMHSYSHAPHTASSNM